MSSSSTTTDPNHKRNQTIRAQSIRSFMAKFGMTQHEATATVDSEMARLYAPNPWEVANRCGFPTHTPEARCEERKEEVSVRWGGGESRADVGLGEGCCSRELG